MPNFQVKSSFLSGPASNTRQSFMLKGLSIPPNSTSKLDLNGLLELLSVANDVNLQIKLFSALSAYLMFNKGANIDVVIKCNAVYDKVQRVLARGLPQKSADALNFLSTLLYIDAEEDGTTRRKTLAIYARNMTRVSGCLSAMCEIFTDYMLYHDTWKALCQCLAVACSENEINQSYCSHLIPVCIEKCSQVNIDTLLVLQSLMLNHSRNSQLFLNCNGVKIFTRDLLHYDKCMQLLMTVVQCPEASTLIQQTNVLADLRDFLRLYGPNSQLGQKAIVILNHINAKGKDHQKCAVAAETRMHANKSLIEKDITKKSLLEHDNNAKSENEFEETKVLIQNVMKEIFKWKQSELQNSKKAETKPVCVAMNRSRMSPIVNTSNLSLKQTNKQIPNKMNTLIDNRKSKIINLIENSSRKESQRNIASELSFTFLENNEFKVPESNNTAKCFYRCRKNDTQQLDIDDTQINDTTLDRKLTNRNYKTTSTTLQDFSPNFASTPKHAIETVDVTEATVNSHKTIKSQINQNKFNNLKMKRQKAKQELQQKNKSLKNRSLGARFFGAINESCTTFVKTVKNIFNKKESSIDSRNETTQSSNDAENTVVKHRRSKTYSFINYMRKRDLVLNDNWMNNKVSDPSEISTLTANSCRTCNNTEVLKLKLTKDEFLKQTVKKLKLGINLYGCDFKKISKTMWPRETYMTPLVLYNLYRKLLLK